MYVRPCCNGSSKRRKGYEVEAQDESSVIDVETGEPLTRSAGCLIF